MPRENLLFGFILAVILWLFAAWQIGQSISADPFQLVSPKTEKELKIRVTGAVENSDTYSFESGDTVEKILEKVTLAAEANPSGLNLKAALIADSELEIPDTKKTENNIEPEILYQEKDSDFVIYNLTMPDSLNPSLSKSSKP